MRIPRFLATALVVIGLTIPLFNSIAIAQNNNIILTVTAPEWMQDTFNDELFSQFESENPGVDVVFVISGDSMYFGSAAYDPDNFFDSAAEYAQRADVLYVSNYTLTPEATRAGMFLDLSPLTASDPTLNADDFFPAAWQSFQWDNGIWGLPVSLTLNVLVYNKTRFDELGLAYPDASWTLDDFTNTVRALSETNESGEVTMPGYLDWSAPGLLFRAFLGEGVYDTSVTPNGVNFGNPALENLLTVWTEFSLEGHTGSNFSGSSQEVPMRVDGLYMLSNGMMMGGSDAADEWAAALLPGGVAGVRAEGFGISAGTQYPEQAYALTKFLANNVEVTTRIFGDSPARQSLVGAESDSETIMRMELSDEAIAIRDQALAAAIPASELRFMDYINMALFSMNPEGDNLDAAGALQQAEDTANAVLQAADERRNAASLIVAQPTPTPVLSAGEVSVRFSYRAFISPLPNREQWEQMIQEFVSNDPQIGQIEFTAGFGGQEEEDIDCYVQPYNQVQSIDLGSLLNLDPFVNDDPAFDRDDFLMGVLSQVTREDMIWSLPMFIQPEVLWYNSVRFSEAGAQLPENGWTVDQFIDTLETLRIDPNDDAPFVPGLNSANAYVLLLTAAFGGLPLDYRMTPPVINFTDPTTVDALRQVLDLAREGYIDYSALANNSGGSFMGNQLIYNEPLSALSFRMRTTSDIETGDYVDPYRMTTFPRGTEFTGITYDIGGGYINADSPNPDACYRWLSALSERPDLFSAMPARRSALGALEATMMQSEDLIAVFDEIDTLLQDPSTIVIPSQFSGGGFFEGAYFLSVWLNRALDAYVLEDADLEAELADAELLATTYMGCIDSIERIPQGDILEMDSEAQTAYFEQFTECAISVDPSLASMFGLSTSSE